MRAITDGGRALEGPAPLGTQSNNNFLYPNNLHKAPNSEGLVREVGTGFSSGVIFLLFEGWRGRQLFESLREHLLSGVPLGNWNPSIGVFLKNELSIPSFTCRSQGLKCFANGQRLVFTETEFHLLQASLKNPDPMNPVILSSLLCTYEQSVNSEAS